jgi:hypothetical protein
MKAYLSLLALASAALAKELPKDEVRGAELYDSGKVHEALMAKKHASFNRQRALGRYASAQYQELDFTECQNGKAVAVKGDANNTFNCNAVSILPYPSYTLELAG